MCGFAGFLDKNIAISSIATLNAMSHALIHRGPDDSGHWIDHECGIGLAHRRLSIVDVSSAGAQPMTSNCGRYILSFNGEIYNHINLRKELNKTEMIVSWRGQSDTETLLACISIWGINETLGRCIGMFAFAIWDRVERCLILARDRMGEKPLYYGWQGSGSNSAFIFASELAAVKRHPKFENKLENASISLFMKFGYIPAPYSIYKNIFKLLPGHTLRLSFDSPNSFSVPYWTLDEAIQNGLNNPILESEKDTISSLEKLLKETVLGQMASDVPLGAFLSGGIDSSLIVALMQSQSKKPIKTFTIGFDNKDYNEASHARNISKILMTDHEELFVSSVNISDAIEKIPSMYGEPFSDSSQIPTYLVSQMARKKVTVALSGDGADELFGGYSRYVLSKKLWPYVNLFPQWCRHKVSVILLNTPVESWNRILSPYMKYIPSHMRQANVGEKLHKGARLLDAVSIGNLHNTLSTHWAPFEIVNNDRIDYYSLEPNQNFPKEINDIQKMMAKDSVQYLPDDILVKMDRASMVNSLEGRMPFLDHRVVDFSWRIPHSYKFREGKGKWILRQILYKYVPKEIVDRPKMGFSIPLDELLRGPLRDWAENLLSEKELNNNGYLNSDVVRSRWREHITGKANWQHHLWDVLMFQQWISKEK